MSYRRLIGGPLVAAGLLVALAGSATAATYTDYECRTPTGAVGPATGFGMKKDGNGDLGNTCGAADGRLWVGFGGSGPWHSSDAAAQVFAAPEGTTIAGFELARHSTGLNGIGPAPVAFRVAVDGVAVDGCGRLGQAACNDFDGTIAPTGTAAQQVLVEISCLGSPNEECRAADGSPAPRVDVDRAKFTLTDNSGPQITAVRGLLAAPGEVAGRAGLEFDATDLGGGMYKLYVSVDGALIETRSLDQGTGLCIDADPANADPFEFRSKQPCPTDLKNVPVVIDTEKLPNGTHKIDVTLEDAAGNRTTVFAPAAGFQVLNQTPNGVGADRNAKLTMYFVKARGKTRQRLRSLKGERVVTRGRLVDSRGRGIRGAEIDVYHLVRGKPQLLKTGLKSRRLGRVTLILPNNVYGDAEGLRTLMFEYKAFRPSSTPTSRQTLRLTVRDKRGRPVTGPRARR